MFFLFGTRGYMLHRRCILLLLIHRPVLLLAVLEVSPLAKLFVTLGYSRIVSSILLFLFPHLLLVMAECLSRSRDCYLLSSCFSCFFVYSYWYVVVVYHVEVSVNVYSSYV